jgi:hypothetical protein
MRNPPNLFRTLDLLDADPRALLLTFLLGLIGAGACTWIKTPLPWLIGPLFLTASAKVGGLELACPPQVRQAGQWVIGTALGLYFTPAVVKVLASYVGFIAAAVGFAVLLGIGCGWILRRLTGVDRTTAFFAMALGGASEMVNQAERQGGAADRVAAAHSLRIMLIVAIVPFGYTLWGAHALVPGLGSAPMVDYAGLSLLVLLTGLSALALAWFEGPNSWMLGPMAAAIGLTSSEINLSALPEWLGHVGQLFIGISLGTQFTPDFRHTAPRYLGSVVLCGLIALLVAAGFGYVLASMSGIGVATAILATAPGGIAEMSLTARTLQLGVPIVTAFHVGRMVALVLIAGPLYKALNILKKEG